MLGYLKMLIRTPLFLIVLRINIKSYFCSEIHMLMLLSSKHFVMTLNLALPRIPCFIP